MLTHEHTKVHNCFSKERLVDRVIYLEFVCTIHLTFVFRVVILLSCFGEFHQTRMVLLTSTSVPLNLVRKEESRCILPRDNRAPRKYCRIRSKTIGPHCNRYFVSFWLHHFHFADTLFILIKMLTATVC